MANNNYPQITSVTSEALQSQIRSLLPSQEGFGTDLMAQNVIVPVIDLTAAAEGSTVGQNLQTAYSFGSQTSFSVYNTTSTIINNTGFWLVRGNANVGIDASNSGSASIALSDGLASKDIYNFGNNAWGTPAQVNLLPLFELVVFLDSGKSLTMTSNTLARIYGSYRQIADINGTLVQPSGFNPQ